MAGHRTRRSCWRRSGSSGSGGTTRSTCVLTLVRFASLACVTPLHRRSLTQPRRPLSCTRAARGHSSARAAVAARPCLESLAESAARCSCRLITIIELLGRIPSVSRARSCAVEHLYAPGQGALAIVCRASDAPIEAILRTLDHRTTSLVSLELSSFELLHAACPIPCTCLFFSPRGRRVSPFSD